MMPLYNIIVANNDGIICLILISINQTLLKNDKSTFVKQIIKIWSVSTRLSEHLIAIRDLNKFESASISMLFQTNKEKKRNM